MGGQAVGSDGLEEPVLQHIQVRVVPVVGNLTRIVPSHHIPGLRGRAGDKTVHQSAVDAVERVCPIVTSALVDQAGIVGGRDARPAGRIGNANTGRQAFGAGIRPEVMIEAAILLHDEDEMLDLLEARRSGGRRRGLSGCAACDHERRQDHRQQGEAGAEKPIRLHHY